MGSVGGGANTAAAPWPALSRWEVSSWFFAVAAGPLGRYYELRHETAGPLVPGMREAAPGGLLASGLAEHLLVSAMLR